MTIHKDDETMAPGKPGRKPSGKSRAEIESASSKAHRQKKLESGKVEVKTFVEPSTKARLADLKDAMGKQTIGEVIDALVAGATPGATGSTSDPHKIDEKS